ncbi:hypothetical protein TNCV_4562541 [Trichonephila clavipes]|nr:hypothetical protein TNCV_4562541 [Trichonephila clavipes]
MGRSVAAIRRCWQERVDSGRFQRHDGSGWPRAAANQEDTLIFIKHFLDQPDLQSIEHVWDMMGRRLYLPWKVQLRDQWSKFGKEPKVTIRMLYRSMSRHVAACFQDKGSSTPY